MLPIRTINEIFRTIPSPRTKLASLVKGRWIDGKPQTVALLHFYLRYIRLFYSPNFLPSRRRDCYTTLRLAPHSCHMNALPVSHPSETLGVQLRASMPVPCQRELDCDKATSYHKLSCPAIQVYLISSLALSVARLRDRHINPRPYQPSQK